jgi:hypothetical protein
VTLILILIRVDATSNVHWLDFNKRVLMLEMHGTNIKKRKKSGYSVRDSIASKTKLFKLKFQARKVL